MLAWDSSARSSIQNFEGGNGDVAITYENEVKTAQASGLEDEAVYPTGSIMIENPVAVVDANADAHCVSDVANAFVEFLHSKEAKEYYTTTGYLRSTDPEKAAGGRPCERVPGDQGPLHGRGPRRLGRAGHDPVRNRRDRDPGQGERGLRSDTMSSVAQVETRRGPLRIPHRTAAVLRHLALRGAAIVYLGLLVVLPVIAVITKGFGEGLGAFTHAMDAPGRMGGDRADPRGWPPWWAR